MSGLTGLTAGRGASVARARGAESDRHDDSALFVNTGAVWPRASRPRSAGAGISLTPVLLEGAAREHGFRTIWFWEGVVVLALVVPLAHGPGGCLADRFEDRLLLAGALLVLVLAVAVRSAGFVSPGWTALGYAAAAGTADNAVRTLEATGFPACFGLTHIATIRGVVHAVAVAATAAGPFLFALARSTTDSYRPVLTLAASSPSPWPWRRRSSPGRVAVQEGWRLNPC